MTSRPYLTKSRYLQGLQCPKLLWLSIHESESISGEIDEATQYKFDVGNKIGEYARKRFSSGALVEENHFQLLQAIESTKTLAKKGTLALFEATAKFGDILCRADILERINKNGAAWNLHEVKMNGEVKDVHYDDVAIQRYCFEKAGYDIRKTFLVHVNKEYLRQGPIDPEAFLMAEDITRDVKEKMIGIKSKAQKFIEVIGSKRCPSIKAGEQCSSPYLCPFFDYCNSQIKRYSIYELPYGKKAIPKLEEMGIELLKNIPDNFVLSERQRQLVLSNKTKKPVINKVGIKKHLAALVYPLYYFDFETICAAIPPFNNSHPYQTIPFQFSLHIQKKKCGRCEHFEYLPEDASDPRESLIKEMGRLLGKKGSIIAYNISFETRVIKDLAKSFPQYADKLLGLIPRFWDLIIPFRNGDYTHFDFCGSASLKNVLPVLVPTLSYKTLNIQEGGTASLKYERWVNGKMPIKEWNKTRIDLLAYCKLDTLAMAEILKKLSADV